MSNIFIGLKKTCLGVLERGERGKGNEKGLKEGKGIEMSTTVLPFAMLALFRFVFTYPQAVCIALLPNMVRFIPFLLIPKSMILISSKLSFCGKTMFWGFKSRCTIPLEWQ